MQSARCGSPPDYKYQYVNCCAKMTVISKSISGRVMFEKSPVDMRQHLTKTHLHALLDFAASQSPSIFYIGNLAGNASARFISANIEPITGHKQEAFLEQNGFGISQIHPDDREPYLDALAELETKGALTLEYRFATAAGSYLWVRDELRLIEAPDRSDEFVGCMSDITREKNAQSQLAIADAKRRRSAQLLEDAVQSLPNGFTIYDADNKLVLTNRSLALLIDETADPGDFIGLQRETLSDLVFPKLRSFGGRKITDDPKANRKIKEHMLNFGSEGTEIEFKSGIWRLVTAHPTSEGGTVIVSVDITRQKRAEAIIRDSEEQFRSIVEANPLPVRVSVLGTWELLYESPAAARLFGESWPSEAGRVTSESYADRQTGDHIIDQLNTHRRIDGYELQMKRKNGSIFWAAVSSRVVPFRDRDVCVTSIVDLTETREREREIKRAHEILEDAIESLSEGFVLYDSDDRLVTCNTQYRAYNRDCEDLLVKGAHWQDVNRVRAERGFFEIPDGDLEEWMRVQMSERGVASHEIFRSSAGQWFEYSHRPTRQSGFVSTWRDITESKTLELTLRDSEEMVRQVLEACPVPITMNRVEDGTIIYECPAARDMLGVSEATEGTSVISRWVDPAERERYLKQLHRTGAVDGLEIRYRRSDGHEFPCALSSRLIDYRGEAVIVSNLLDLTERKAAEEELARQREMLHQSEKLSALGEVLAGVSHELNNPLSVLVGQAQMLIETCDDEQTLERARKISNAADRCTRIVKSFLAMARDEPTEMAPVDVNAAVEEALELTAYALRTSGIDLSLRMAKELPVISGDGDQLRQVFTNLIINAHHALMDGQGTRKLHVSTTFQPKSDRIAIRVRDSGTGIPDHIRDRIFEPLFTTKKVGTGTGMGLALSYRIIQAHGGDITLESGPGEGASFLVTLPRHSKKTAMNGGRKSDRKRTCNFQILVIDDEDDVGEIIADVLRHDGHDVDFAASGLSALDMIKRRDYDVILSDIRMPNMDGPAFCRALSESHPQAMGGLAFVTGDTLSPQVKEFLETCERPYLEKPLVPREIRELVNLLVRRQRET